VLDKNILDSIEKRVQEAHDEERELTACEKDREYLYLRLVELVNNSILDLLAVPNKPSLDG